MHMKTIWKQEMEIKWKPESMLFHMPIHLHGLYIEAGFMFPISIVIFMQCKINFKIYDES